MAFKRTIGLRSERSESDGSLRILASTDAPINFGGWTEILEHGGAEIDTSAARSLLLNHDANQIVGSAGEYEIGKSEMTCRASIMEGAKLATGPSVQDAVDSGALRGISISYDYDANNPDDVEVDSNSRTIRAKRWRLLEVSLTPIPADKGCQVRAYPIDDAEPGEGESRMDPEDKKESDAEEQVADGEKMEGEKQEEPEEERACSPDHEDKKKMEDDEEKPDEAARNAAILKARSVADAAGVKVTNDSFAGLDDEPAMLRKVIEIQKEEAMERHSAPNAPVAPVSVTMDAGDKFIRAAGNGLARSIGMEEDKGDADFGAIYLPATEMIRRCAMHDGQREAENWGPMELAHYALRRMSYSRDAGANKTSASFSVLTGNIANKAILKGFNSYQAVYGAFCTIKDAANFNERPHVAAAIGRLIETPEGEAFPESNQKEGTYNSQLAMWGHTLSITEQALVNDELGEIMRSFLRYGYSAARTIDRQAFSALLNGDYTNDLTSSAALGTQGNLDKVRSGLKQKLSPAGEKMENDPKILLVDPSNRYNADAATGQLYGVSTGANPQVGSNAVRGVQVIDSTFVGDTSLKSGVATTDYYLLSDPMLCDTVTVEFLRGQREPQIVPFDAGAVAAAKWKIYLPFQATLATHTDSEDNVRVTGVQKATA